MLLGLVWIAVAIVALLTLPVSKSNPLNGVFTKISILFLLTAILRLFSCFDFSSFSNCTNMISYLNYRKKEGINQLFLCTHHTRRSSNMFRPPLTYNIPYYAMMPPSSKSPWFLETSDLSSYSRSPEHSFFDRFSWLLPLLRPTLSTLCSRSLVSFFFFLFLDLFFSWLL